MIRAVVRSLLVVCALGGVALAAEPAPKAPIAHKHKHKKKVHKARKARHRHRRHHKAKAKLPSATRSPAAAH
jgi:hypothetical protein